MHQNAKENKAVNYDNIKQYMLFEVFLFNKVSFESKYDICCFVYANSSIAMQDSRNGAVWQKH